MSKHADKTYTPPPDKAITHRALIIAALADGTTRVFNPSICEDTLATAACLKKLGIRIKFSKTSLQVKGLGLKGLKKPAGPLNAGQSGTTMRLMAGVLAGQDFDSVIKGHGSLLKRPMTRLTKPLSAMGARVSSSGGRPPLKISCAPLTGACLKLSVPSAQVKSAALLAGLYAGGRTSVTERVKTRDHTERLLKHLRAKIKTSGLKTVLEPGALKAGRIKIPGDISSAAPFIAAALLLGRTLLIREVGLNPARLGLVKTLQRMGARLKVKVKRSGPEPVGEIIIFPAKLKGVKIAPDEIPAMIDELALLALLAASAKGKTVIRGITELRHKESDRIKTTSALLRRLGVKAAFKTDSLTITGPQKLLGGGSIETFNDHRVAMAAAVGSLLAEKPVKIKNAGCVKKSYPGFFHDFKKVFQ
ncbi:MAG: 3-phosphoshikimate 1-carboxyvinyltransferase [Elusimicrobia bacterium GWF2_52_66]|nr:MAG: 3-phosphoshikimate 1-carboxyvinyltransferase [Elusimicrobia bacterium GWA2_51_34]OGR85551.1 MAG: 3-phosphoshikimate 1-carboxyvinyltransferase [Elusimicrobia bacterium GWF2_52_66]HAF96241.1 3-phosphoshikimate 1-carboxyvinyltransferase [Elusimicrobiota bacterium]HCE97851.1 3-phosphoshikimate 1-carboxyvinyltransferase [Elusimicrobiota bacterium]